MSVMLQSMRHAVRRSTFLPFRRCLTTAPDAAEKLLSEAVSSVGNLTGGQTSALPNTTKLAAPVPRSTPRFGRGPLPQIMNIPPAEDPLLVFLTNMIMRNGKKQTAARVVSRLLLHLHAFTRAPPLPIVREAILLASPAIRLVNIRKSIKNVMHPIALSERQRTRMGIHWLLEACKERPEQEIGERLARVMLDVLKREHNNPVLKKKDALHKLGTVNRGNVFKKMA